MQTDTNNIIDDLDEEIIRVKHMINEKGYNNYSAFNHIVRKYRNELKELSKIIRHDSFEEKIKNYEDC
jgi:aconitase B